MGVCSSTESAGAPPTPVSERQQPQTPRSGPASGRRPSSGCVGEIACVVSDFAAEAAEELAVRRGELVTISAGPTREGWCAVSVERAGEAAPRSGLVPWSHLVSAAHANEAAAASGASPARVLSPRVRAGTEDIAIARGAGGRLGVDLDDDNRVRNVASGSAAAGLLGIGDEILAVDGVPLAGSSILAVIDAQQPRHLLTVKRAHAPRAPAAQPGSQFSPADVQGGSRVTVVRREVLVRRTGSRLGIDINERNVIVKLIPGTHAAREKQLREGDVVVAVDGEALDGRWLAQVLVPHAEECRLTVESESWRVGTMQGHEAGALAARCDGHVSTLSDIHSLKAWRLRDMPSGESAALPPASPSGGVSPMRASSAAGSEAGGTLPRGSGGTLRRAAPSLPAQHSTLNMEELLRVAMEAAAADPSKERAFMEMLTRYRQHPSIARREREASESARARRETFRADFERERARIPEGVRLRMNSIDELVDAGCDWDLASEIMHFPILKFLTASHEQMEALPIIETVKHNLDRKMPLPYARAVIFALPDKFEIDKWQAAHGKGVRQEWLETQQRIFSEMDDVAADAPRPISPALAVCAGEGDGSSCRCSVTAVDPAQVELIEAGGGSTLPRQQFAVTGSTLPGSTLPRRGSGAEEANTPLSKFPLQQRASAGTQSGTLGTLPPEQRPSAGRAPPLDGDEGTEAGCLSSSSSTVESPRSDPSPARPAAAPHRAEEAPPAEASRSRGGKGKGKSYRDTTLLNRIGQGTYGSVFRGSCRDEEVAVKVMLLQADSAEDIKREIKIMRECTCEHIVAYKDAFVREYQMRSTLWVVMEFCEAGSTLDVMRKVGRGFDEPCVAGICRGVLRALEYMHVERKVIHRDIKAANVLLASDGTVKLADLGIVAQLQHTMSKRGTMIGTPHWMAPETLSQSGPDDGKYDTKVDIWGAGITAIELAQMWPPFSNIKAVFQVMMLIVNGAPPCVDSHVEASDAFRAFLAAALVKEPADRPSARTLLDDPFLRDASIDSLREVIASHLSSYKAQRDSPAGPSTPPPSEPPPAPLGELEKTMVL
mmetsp:Transcript_22047/g.70390  ORF Transcript_22047/g.70390 Transcript_22047/m.70390 type:complete len:1061 (+) Transcript_22047:97-3279(+)